MSPQQVASRFQAEEVWLPFSEALSAWDNQSHELLLNDQLRVSAYRAAIQQTVKPGMTVMDLGTGTGILALWALEAGAAKVYGIEMNAEILQIAQRRIESAGYTGRFVPLQGVSFEKQLQEPVDMLISEIIGNLADNENFVPILLDATKRFLRPLGVQIPRQVISYLVPVEAKSAYRQVADGKWRGLPADAGVPHAARNAFDLYYDSILPHAGYLSSPQALRNYRGEWTEDPAYAVHLRWCVQRRGQFTGFKGYFVADLAEGVVLDISGDDTRGHMSSDSWKHAFLPILHPFDVEPDDTLLLNFSRRVDAAAGGWGRQIYTWSGQIRRAGRIMGEFFQSTGRGAA